MERSKKENMYPYAESFFRNHFEYNNIVWRILVAVYEKVTHTKLKAYIQSRPSLQGVAFDTDADGYMHGLNGMKLSCEDAPNRKTLVSGLRRRRHERSSFLWLVHCSIKKGSVNSRLGLCNRIRCTIRLHFAAKASAAANGSAKTPVLQRLWRQKKVQLCKRLHIRQCIRGSHAQN